MRDRRQRARPRIGLAIAGLDIDLRLQDVNEWDDSAGSWDGS